MAVDRITVKTLISSDKQKVWDYYTEPKHIIEWNFADPSWHCPSATNDLRIGGNYLARMEAKDGSVGFDFAATYLKVEHLNRLVYEFGGREAEIKFEAHEDGVTVSISFNPETEHPIDMQRAGWQAILDNFKNYTENHLGN
jgi:uncharacterized protein YndB with AHSA1/START domain